MFAVRLLIFIVISCKKIQQINCFLCDLFNINKFYNIKILKNEFKKFNNN